MPELPEVETTRRGILPHVAGRIVTAVHLRTRRFRKPVSPTLVRELPGAVIDDVERRGKYLLFRTARGAMILHLGMSGSLRVLDERVAPGRHDHLDLVLAGGRVLRFNDPRRFGIVSWTRRDPRRHVLLARLGPEPLEAAFDGEHLYRLSRRRRAPLRNFLIDGRVVAGVGNIYANEAAFRAGIHPARPAGRIARARYEQLASALRAVLAEALAAGGTTLRDFRQSDGRPGYFRIALAVYGREGEPCRRCAAPVRRRAVGGRSLFFCPRCQR